MISLGLYRSTMPCANRVEQARIESSVHQSQNLSMLGTTENQEIQISLHLSIQ